MVKFQTNIGCISLSPVVFTTLVGDAAVSCFGVKGMAMRSVTDGLVHLLKRESMHKGVYIEYNDDSSISIELHIVIDEGVNIPALAGSIISEVRYKVEDSTGIKVKSVDIFVDSLSKD